MNYVFFNNGRLWIHAEYGGRYEERDAAKYFATKGLDGMTLVEGIEFINGLYQGGRLFIRDRSYMTVRLNRSIDIGLEEEIYGGRGPTNDSYVCYNDRGLYIEKYIHASLYNDYTTKKYECQCSYDILEDFGLKEIEIETDEEKRIRISKLIEQLDSMQLDRKYNEYYWRSISL